MECPPFVLGERVGLQVPEAGGAEGLEVFGALQKEDGPLGIYILIYMSIYMHIYI